MVQGMVDQMIAEEDMRRRKKKAKKKAKMKAKTKEFQHPRYMQKPAHHRDRLEPRQRNEQPAPEKRKDIQDRGEVREDRAKERRRGWGTMGRIGHEGWAGG